MGRWISWDNPARVWASSGVKTRSGGSRLR